MIGSVDTFAMRLMFTIVRFVFMIICHLRIAIIRASLLNQAPGGAEVSYQRKRERDKKTDKRSKI